jgi:hypothetical protein
LEAGLAVMRRHAPDHRAIPQALVELGRCQAAQGQRGPAIALLEEALHMREAEGTRPVFIGLTRMDLAMLRGESRGQRGRARAELLAALDELRTEAAAAADEIAAAEAWLAGHPPI